MSLERTLIIECINFHITSPTLVVLLAFSLGIQITIENIITLYRPHPRVLQFTMACLQRRVSIASHFNSVHYYNKQQLNNLVSFECVIFTNTHSVTVQTFTLQCFIAMINTFISHWFQLSLLHCAAFYTLHCNKTKLYRHLSFTSIILVYFYKQIFNTFQVEHKILFLLFSCMENRLLHGEPFLVADIKVL